MKRTREQIKGIHDLLNHVRLELNTSYRNGIYLEPFNDLTELVNEIYEIEEEKDYKIYECHNCKSLFEKRGLKPIKP